MTDLNSKTLLFLSIVYLFSVLPAVNAADNTEKYDAEIAQTTTSVPKLAHVSHDAEHAVDQRAAKNICAEVNTEFNYLGNIESMKFHRAGCEYACMMAASKRVGFRSQADARIAGMKPCNWCFPRWWLHVEARILTPGTTQEANEIESVEMHAQTSSISVERHH